MEYNYNSWAGVPPIPALYPNPSPPVMTNSDQSVPQNPNPSSYALGYGGGHEFQGKCLVYRYGQIDCATSSVEATQVYYQDPNVVRLLGSNGPFRTGEIAAVSLNGAKNLTPANVNSNFFFQPPRSGSWGGGQRKIKIQPVWCHVCKIEFTSQTVLDQHILGKKHKKSLDNLKGGSVITASTSAPRVASAASENPFVGLHEEPNKVNSANGRDSVNKADRGALAGNSLPRACAPPGLVGAQRDSDTRCKSKKKKKKVVENLETKKRKVLEGGAATDDVRICLPCNVVCNSESVFRTHLIGKKHIANITKQQKSVPASASLVPLEVSVSTFIGPQEKPGIVNSGDGQDPMKKAAELSEKLETKTQKVLEGGAAANDVRQCLVCKVVCNSETVFSHHVTGKKHIANMKRQASGVTPAS